MSLRSGGLPTHTHCSSGPGAQCGSLGPWGLRLSCCSHPGDPPARLWLPGPPPVKGCISLLLTVLCPDAAGPCPVWGSRVGRPWCWMTRSPGLFQLLLPLLSTLPRWSFPQSGSEPWLPASASSGPSAKQRPEPRDSGTAHRARGLPPRTPQPRWSAPVPPPRPWPPAFRTGMQSWSCISASVPATLVPLPSPSARQAALPLPVPCLRYIYILEFF